MGISAVKAVLLEALHRADKMQALQWAIENIDDSEDIDLPARWGILGSRAPSAAAAAAAAAVCILFSAVCL